VSTNGFSERNCLGPMDNLSITILVEHDARKVNEKVVEALNDVAEDIVHRLGEIKGIDMIEVEIISRRR
jgi:hypothetical protein